MITLEGIKAVQDQIVKLVPRPYKIVSIIGKIPNEFKKEFEMLEGVNSITGYTLHPNTFLLHIFQLLIFIRGRINPLRNFAFCSRFTGSRSCLYVEGDDQKSVIIHYAVDKYFDKVRDRYQLHS